MWPEIKYTALELKDILTVSVALAALLTSISAAVFSAFVQRRQKREDLRSEFGEAILGIADCREKLDELRRELGNDFFKPQALSRRQVIADRRNFFLSKCLFVAERERTEITPFESLLLAAALVDSGQIGRSVAFYRQAYMASPNDFEKAIARRVYGRALALVEVGNSKEGFEHMLAAANIFFELASQSEFDNDFMLTESSETYRRLVHVAIRNREFAIARQGLKLYRKNNSKIKDRDRRSLHVKSANQLSRLLR